MSVLQDENSTKTPAQDESTLNKDEKEEKSNEEKESEPEKTTSETTNEEISPEKVADIPPKTEL